MYVCVCARARAIVMFGWCGCCFPCWMTLKTRYPENCILISMSRGKHICILSHTSAHACTQQLHVSQCSLTWARARANPCRAAPARWSGRGRAVSDGWRKHRSVFYQIFNSSLFAWFDEIQLELFNWIQFASVLNAALTIIATNKPMTPENCVHPQAPTHTHTPDFTESTRNCWWSRSSIISTVQILILLLPPAPFFLQFFRLLSSRSTSHSRASYSSKNTSVSEV